MKREREIKMERYQRHEGEREMERERGIDDSKMREGESDR